MSGRVRRAVERALRDVQDVAVVVERRRHERRAGGERRWQARGPVPGDRRRVAYAEGRRVAERRAVLVPAAVPLEAGRAARQHAAALSFVAPLTVPEDFRRDVEAVRAIVRFTSGERDCAELYERWFDPLYTYLRVTLDRGADVDALVAAALADALRELAAGAAPSPTEVRPWLFGIAYRTARPRVLELRPPDLPAAGDRGGDDELHWVKDEELVLLVERRPAPERHVLVLRYFAGLSFAEVAGVMGIEPPRAIALHRAAVASLDATLASVARGPRAEERHPMGRLVHQTPTLRQRRRALLAA
jgi:DNA-directed RNA polymerase specialized sigma24 family protein